MQTLPVWKPTPVCPALKMNSRIQRVDVAITRAIVEVVPGGVAVIADTRLHRRFLLVPARAPVHVHAATATVEVEAEAEVVLTLPHPLQGRALLLLIHQVRHRPDAKIIIHENTVLVARLQMHLVSGPKMRFSQRLPCRMPTPLPILLPF